MFKVNLLKGFLYPLSSPRRLLVAWLVLPLSLLLLVPPILVSLGVFSTVSMTLTHGLGFSALAIAVCVLVGALPFTALTGYLLRCRKTVIEGENILPSWSGFGTLMADGGKMDTLGLIIGLPTMAFFWGGLVSVIASFTNLNLHRDWWSLAVALVGSGTGLLFLAGAVVLWLLVMFFSPIATLRLALGSSPVGALSMGGMLRDIARGPVDYVLCCLLVGVISAAFSAAQAACWPLIVIGFPVQVYLQVVWAHLLGQYARAYMP